MILISPFAKAMRSGERHPKNYPHWERVIELLQSKGCSLVQVGISGEQKLLDNVRLDQSMDQLKDLVLSCDTWVGVDSFFQHFCWDLGKPGVVIFAQSDPNIFGHPENINLLKDRKYLRPNQFLIWEQCEFIEEAFVSPEEVVDAVLQLINK